jgi:hypothetical protein
MHADTCCTYERPSLVATVSVIRLCRSFTAAVTYRAACRAVEVDVPHELALEFALVVTRAATTTIVLRAASETKDVAAWCIYETGISVSSPKK